MLVSAVSSTEPAVVIQPHARRFPNVEGRRLLTCAMLWCFLVLAFSLQEVLVVRLAGGTQTWGPIAVRQALGWTLWAALAPAVFILAARIPLTGRNTGRNLLVHFAAAAAIAAIHSFLLAAIYPLFYYAPSMAALHDVFWSRIYVAFSLNVVIYAVIVAIAHAMKHAKAASDRQILAAQLESRAAKAELSLLHAQLQPHFLFNALNSVVELVDADPARATRMVRSLSALLRRALASASTSSSTVREELDFVRQYAEIQQIRFPRLRVDVDADEDVMAAVIPNLLLQPLVENAIKYTVGVRGDGVVGVRVERKGDRVSLSVSDDGAGFGASAQTNGRLDGTGTGLANVRARLEHAYGGDYSLELGDAGKQGATVSILLPFGS